MGRGDHRLFDGRLDRHVVQHPSTANSGAAQEHHVGAELAEDLFGQWPDERLLVAAQHTAQQHQLDRVVTADLVEHREIGRDDGDGAATEFPCDEWRARPDVEHDDIAVADEPGGFDRHPLAELVVGAGLRQEGVLDAAGVGDVGTAALGEHRSAVEALEPATLGEYVQIASDGGFADTQCPGKLHDRLPPAAERSEDSFMALGEEHAGNRTHDVTDSARLCASFGENSRISGGFTPATLSSRSECRMDTHRTLNYVRRWR